MLDESRLFLSWMSFKLLSRGLMNAAGDSEGRIETLLFVGGGAGAMDQ